MKTIQEELGGSPSDLEIAELRKKAQHKEWSIEVDEIFEKEYKQRSKFKDLVIDNLQTEVKSLSLSSGRHFTFIFNSRFEIIVERFAFPVRSPKPSKVP